MSTLRDKYTPRDAARIAALGCSTETALMPLTIRRLCELITELQARVDALEGTKRPTLAQRVLRRA